MNIDSYIKEGNLMGLRYLLLDLCSYPDEDFSIEYIGVLLHKVYYSTEIMQEARGLSFAVGNTRVSVLLDEVLEARGDPI